VGVLLPHDEVIGIDRERGIDIAELGNLFFDHDDLLRVPIGQRLEHDIVVEREDGCCCANSKGKRQHYGERKTGRLTQLTEGATQVLKECLHGNPRAAMSAIATQQVPYQKQACRQARIDNSLVLYTRLGAGRFCTKSESDVRKRTRRCFVRSEFREDRGRSASDLVLGQLPHRR